ncbi:sensor histidine kinase [Agreia sp. Leaf210]|uniref:sensor histidine kinase n=2 Tax=Bacteria TaxID=2 RepID=UPI000A801A53|nr:sensor histidine kinase [Agreia sp. Leaf210]
MTTQTLDMTHQLDSATLDTMIHSDGAAPVQNRLRRRWARVPRELGFLLATLPVVTIAFIALVTLFSLGASTVVLVGGFFVLAAAMVTARWFGAVELVRLEAAGMPPIARPTWNLPRRPGILGWLKRYLGDGHYWLYLLHGGVVNFAVGVATWCVAITWLVTGLGGVSFGIWSRFLPPHEAGNLWINKVVIEFVVPGTQLGNDPDVLQRNETILYLILGLAMLATLPFVTRGLVRIHHGIARGMLGRFASDDLKREVAALGASRDAAVSAEDHSLRRLERDIHDGPQQRLVRLQFDLASAERALDSDPATARALLEGAREQSRDTLEELRELSRGFAPPLLQDRGLAAALESLAVRSTVPTSIRLSLGETEIAPEVERSVYFIAAELLANVAKHAAATMATVSASVRESDAGERVLELTVFDDGVGKAAETAGHGLAGLAERVSGLRGELTITSPEGGPTMIATRIPLS